MIEEFLDKLCIELGMAAPEKPPKGAPFRVVFGVGEVSFLDLNPGLFIEAPLGPPPSEKKKEDLYILLMRANLLGQGTGGASLGLNEKEALTLSLGLPYELNYEAFKEKLEDFINYLNYWKDEIAKFAKQG